MNAKRAALIIGLSFIFAAGLGRPICAQSATQHFVCHTGFTASDCRTKMDVLRTALRKYPTQDLADWTWVVVHSNDWKRILSDRKLSPGIPAFTYLSERETFFDEALLEAASPRGVELVASWRITISELLDLAIRHEMGHALCKERDEAAAKRTAQLLLEAPTLDTFRACRPRNPERNSPRVPDKDGVT